jgi:hypothetical protein
MLFQTHIQNAMHVSGGEGLWIRCLVKLHNGSQNGRMASLTHSMISCLSFIRFDSLAASYQAQATDYQNVSVRLGFLLVLDLVGTGNAGTPHLSSLIQTRTVHRAGEDIPRLLVIVRVPGNRKRPSDLTKAAKGNSNVSRS